jgi:hypothetical protein
MHSFGTIFNTLKFKTFCGVHIFPKAPNDVPQFDDFPVSGLRLITTHLGLL